MTVITEKFHFVSARKGRRQIKPGCARIADTPKGRVPRISRLMALAIHFEGLLRQGGVYNQADLADLGHVSRARMTQIMNLLHLAPDIQQAILFLPEITTGRDPITERDVRPITRQIDWQIQRRMWSDLADTCNSAQRAHA